MARMRFVQTDNTVKSEHVLSIKQSRHQRKARLYKILTILLTLTSIGEAIYIYVHR